MKVGMKPKTRIQIAQELEISYSTLWRLLKKLSIKLPNGLIYPAKQQEIYNALFGNYEIRDNERF